MAAGLVAGYGAFAWIAGRFLYPARDPRRGWVYVSRAADLQVGQSLRYQTPAGATVNITRRGSGQAAADFVALSSTCPHLGCQVHWQSDQNRYFCPCHNGVFDPSGKGIGGPPGDAGQSLKPFDLRVEGGLLYIEVPLEGLADAHHHGEVLSPSAGPEGPGHDPCLQPRRPHGLPGHPA
ncbi:MAG: Rieske (2Fe-2S) protein [Planctomycetes bacterium]|nr:Rieske (2Fe-2S) protein [Planctomycetota bacterium]